jgi:hypothetical protein
LRGNAFVFGTLPNCAQHDFSIQKSLLARSPATAQAIADIADALNSILCGRRILEFFTLVALSKRSNYRASNSDVTRRSPRAAVP